VEGGGQVPQQHWAQGNRDKQMVPGGGRGRGVGVNVSQFNLVVIDCSSSLARQGAFSMSHPRWPTDDLNSMATLKSTR
jgi:hypothetical protein